MAIESSACFRRLASAGLLVLSGMLSLCGVAAAQKNLVTTASIIPLASSSNYCQIYQILNNPAGDTLFLDVCGVGGAGALYQLNPGSTTLQTITPAGIDTGGTFFVEGMAMDALGTIYLTDRYSGTNHLYRIPFNASNNSYGAFSASSDSWESMLDSGFENNGTLNVAFFNSAKRDGSGTLFVSTELGNSIMAIPVNADGSVPNFPSGPDAGQPEFQYIIRGLTGKVQPMQVDQNGNIYFIEDPYDVAAKRVTGVFFIPASAYTSCMKTSAAGGGTPTVGCITGSQSEGSLARVDAGNTEKFNGLALDAAGNVYVTDESDGDGGTRNGTLMIPNESGSPVGVTAQSFNFEDAEYLTPSGGNANPLIDPRGFLWTPTGTTANYSPNGSGPIPNTGNFLLWQLGAANLGATPVGTPSAPGEVFFSFSGTVTPASFGGSEPGGANFTASTTNPYPPTGTTTPAIPCTAGPSATGTPTMYIAFSSCEYWPVLTPQGMNSVGDISGQLSMLDANNNVISGSTTYLSGVGEGPAASLLVPAQQTPLATGLVTPQQVAGDSLGNSYVADSGLGKVLMFAAGSTTASAGTPIGTGLTAPTGVAVDGAGNIYIADSGKVLEVPAVNGVLNPAGQTVLQSGLGKNLQLAVDNAQNVYVADPQNGRVVRIYNPQIALLIPTVSTPNTVGTFKAPTAVATDDAGNLYVADGTNLDEINFWGGQTNITTSLAAPVTGLAVDASGSVYVAQTGGIIRIPYEVSTTCSGPCSADAVQIDNSNNAGITAPTGLGLDSLGNLYATADSYSVSSVGTSGVISTPVNAPNLLLLSGAFANFGIVSQFTESDPIDVDVYNIGNEPLSLTGSPNPNFVGADPLDYSVEQDGQNPCDTSGSTPITSGTDCELGIGATTQGLGVSTATMTVTTNAVNAPTTTATLTAYSSDLLCRTLTTITLSPPTGLVYPGATTVTSSTVPDPAAPCATGGVPQGGNIVLTFSPQAKGAAQSTQTQQLAASGQSTFTLTGLDGGSYAVYVAYKGDEAYGGSSSVRTFILPVAQATPAITLGEPDGISPVDGTYYVLQGSTTTLEASVTSTVGSPTGSVQFLNGMTPADPAQNPVTMNGSGVATFNTTNLLAGTYNLTAVYGSDTNFASVTSSVVTIVVTPPIALVTANPTSLTVSAGTAVTSSLTITALEGYSPLNGVQLYCNDATLPPDSECTFDVPTVNLLAPIAGAPQVPQISNVTITTNIPVNEGQLRMGTSPVVFAGMFGLGLLGLALRRRKKFKRSTLQIICLTLLFAGAAIGFSGCTNSGYTKTPSAPHVTTPSGTYNVSIYAIDLLSNKVSSLPFTITLTVK